jgi:hypothetical protein
LETTPTKAGLGYLVQKTKMGILCGLGVQLVMRGLVDPMAQAIRRPSRDSSFLNKNMEVLSMDFKRSFNKKVRYIYLLAVIAFVIHIIYSSSVARKIVLKYSFSGIVEKVVYDKKSIPNVTIDGKTYYLGSTSWNFNYLIAKGDSLKKDSGNITVKLIKHKNGKVIIFDGK